MIIGNGAAAHKARLARLSSPILVRNVGAALTANAEAIRVDTVNILDEGAIFGAGHIASQPGEAPNSDTRELTLSGKVTELVEVADYMQTAVQFGGVRAPYAALHEAGLGGFPERPYLRVTTKRARKTGQNRVRDAVRKTNLGN